MKQVSRALIYMLLGLSLTSSPSNGKVIATFRPDLEFVLNIPQADMPSFHATLLRFADREKMIEVKPVPKAKVRSFFLDLHTGDEAFEFFAIEELRSSPMKIDLYDLDKSRPAKFHAFVESLKMAIIKWPIVSSRASHSE